MRYSKLAAVLTLSVGTLISSAALATNYDEAVSGDLSGDRLNPTILTLTEGSNLITATSVSGDLEYFRLFVPGGKRLSAIVAVSNTGGNVSFIGVQRGTQFTESAVAPNVANILGYTHFGNGNLTVGTDILDNMGTGAGAIGFTPPLAAANYTFWSQETSTAATYTLDFQVTAVPNAAPVPGAAVLMMGVALAIIALVAAPGLRRVTHDQRTDRVGDTRPSVAQHRGHRALAGRPR